MDNRIPNGPCFGALTEEMGPVNLVPAHHQADQATPENPKPGWPPLPAQRCLLEGPLAAWTGSVVCYGCKMPNSNVKSYVRCSHATFCVFWGKSWAIMKAKTWIFHSSKEAPVSFFGAFKGGKSAASHHFVVPLPFASRVKVEGRCLPLLVLMHLRPGQVRSSAGNTLPSTYYTRPPNLITNTAMRSADISGFSAVVKFYLAPTKLPQRPAATMLTRKLPFFPLP